MRLRILLAVVALAALAVLAACTGGTAIEPRGSQPGSTSPGSDVQSVQTVATGLRIPWGLAFLPDGTALVTERGNPVPTFDPTSEPVEAGGVARILSITPAGKVTQVQQLPEVDLKLGEGGLLGIAVSPNYTTDGWVYVYYSTASDNRIARLHLGQSPQPILTGIPVTDNAEFRWHQGGRLAFGPDGMLYASVGETFRTPQIAQDPASLGGKILRLTLDGGPAPGNPFPDSPVWSYGHRNVQGFAWDSKGRMYASEFGHKRFDELNLIEPGRNYGWPHVEGMGTDPAFTNPITTWAPTSDASPAGVAILDDRIYVACLRGRRINRVSLDGRTVEPLLAGRYGRLRTVVVAPDRSLWVTTSNRDQVGREDHIPLTAEDDRILRVTP